MDKDELEAEARNVMSMMKVTGMVDKEVYDFLVEAVEHKINGDCDPVPYFKVPHHVYVHEIGNKATTMDDVQLGAFIRKTLWTVTGKR